jgi:hypothetical protein
MSAPQKTAPVKDTALIRHVHQPGMPPLVNQPGQLQRGHHAAITRTSRIVIRCGTPDVGLVVQTVSLPVVMCSQASGAGGRGSRVTTLPSPVT